MKQRNWKYMTKAYLQQAYHQEQRIKILMRQKRDLQSMLYSLGVSGGSGGSKPVGDPDKFGKLIAKIDAKERSLVDQIDKLVDKKEEIKSKIEKLPDEQQKNILICRYICFMEWKDIQDEFGYAEAQPYKIMSEALRSFYEWYAKDIRGFFQRYKDDSK